MDSQALGGPADIVADLQAFVQILEAPVRAGHAQVSEGEGDLAAAGAAYLAAFRAAMKLANHAAVEVTDLIDRLDDEALVLGTGRDQRLSGRW